MQQLDPDFIALQAALAGEFFLERELGRGGMGVVYLAREAVLERPVALKVLPPGLSTRPEMRERFLREARTAAKLSHPHIVPVFRVEDLGGFVVFSMAYVDGETLGQRLRDHGPLSPHEAARMVREVSWALAYAHARGIVHRDVKPDNIMCETESGRWMVTDFGIAQVAEATPITDEGLVMGTAQFMSPEQCAGEPLDGRSDLYSLGVVAFLATTGRLPFEAADARAALAQHLTRLAPPAHAAAPHLPRGVATAIDRCLAKDPAARFPTGEALADAVSAQAETPAVAAPLRMWLATKDPLRPLYLASGIAGVDLLSELNPLGFGLFAAPLLTHGAFLAYQARRMLAEGYGLEDLRDALRHDAVQRREERTYDADRPPPLASRLLRIATYTCAAAAVVILSLIATMSDVVVRATLIELWQLPAAGVLVGGVLGLAYPGRRLRDEPLPSRLRRGFWNGRGGALLARLSGWRLRRAPGEGLVHRPTELAIGGAAGALFDALPAETRRRLADVPDVIRTLERRAHAARRRIDELTALVAEAGTFDVPGRADDDHRRQVADDVGRTRDEATARLTTILTVLETIRLDLLRLRAGAAGVDSITATLDAARRFGEDVDRAVEANAVVAALVAQPRTPPGGGHAHVGLPS